MCAKRPVPLLTRVLGSLLAIAAGLAVLGPGPLRAGELDRELLRKSASVLYYLDAKGYRTVGVLPFQVQRGGRPASHDDAPLALNLTTRLENSLIMAQDPRGRTIGVIRDATGTANRGEVGPYRSSLASTRRLFELGYDLAWGSNVVRADAFLTGTVINCGKDRSRTQVIIRAFDAKSVRDGNLVMDKVCAFDVSTDEPLLADLGCNYALSMGALKRGATARDRRQLALTLVALADERSLPPIEGGQGKEHTPADIAGFSVELLYNGKKQDVTPLVSDGDGPQAPAYQVATAPEGAEVSLVLTRKDQSSDTLGVVVKLNGQSLWNKEDGEAEKCRKWLYAPSRKEPDRYEGFYTGLEGKNLLKFRTLTAEEAMVKASELGNRVGWIDVTVFASGKRKEAQPPEMQISTRGRPQGLRRGASLQEVRAALLKANGVAMKPVRLGLSRKKELIDAEVEAREGPKIETGSLPNPTRIGHLSIRYWQP